jgi:protein-export membrane protein SecD
MKTWQIVVLVLIALFVVTIAGFTAVGMYFYKQGNPTVSDAGGVRIVLRAETKKLPKGREWTPADLDQTVDVLKKRAQNLGIRGAQVQARGRDEVIVELPGVRDAERYAQLLTHTVSLEFRHLYNVMDKRHPSAKYTMDVNRDSKGSDVFTFTDSRGRTVPASKVIAESKLILSGRDLKPKAVGMKDSRTFETDIPIEFKPEGRRRFADFTRRNIDEHLAIILDGRILSAPVIKSPILDGKAVIEGNFTAEEAQKLADSLNAGPALPAPLKVVSKQVIKPR